MNNPFSPGFIDIHCHILPGIDDGPSEMAESVEMVLIARDDGTSHIFATPHVMAGAWENSADSIEEALKGLRVAAGDGVRLFSGADIRVTPDLPERLERRELPSLGGTPYVLLEFPSYAMPLNLDHLLFGLKRKGFIPIVTHPERYPYFTSDIKLANHLREEGALFQVTALSITGGFGRELKKLTLAMIDLDLVDFVASDGHGVTKRPPVLSKAYREVARQFDRATADRLFYDNPMKIVRAVGD
jgi:protein-tyrosine phosphatase